MRQMEVWFIDEEVLKHHPHGKEKVNRTQDEENVLVISKPWVCKWIQLSEQVIQQWCHYPCFTLPYFMLNACKANANNWLTCSHNFLEGFLQRTALGGWGAVWVNVGVDVESHCKRACHGKSLWNLSSMKLATYNSDPIMVWNVREFYEGLIHNISFQSSLYSNQHKS